jgi:ABC-type lipoprotein export system ATPase subunit
MAKTAAQTNQENRPIIQVENVSKLFRTPNEGLISALQNISLNVSSGEFITVVGPSGCGKSTLLKLIDVLYRVL